MKILAGISVLLYAGAVYMIYHTNNPTLWGYVAVGVLIVAIFFLLKIFLKYEDKNN